MKIFQVSLGREMVVSGLITQGRFAGGQGEEYAEQVTIQVSQHSHWSSSYNAAFSLVESKDP